MSNIVKAEQCAWADPGFLERRFVEFALLILSHFS